MSIEAINWAWKRSGLTSNEKFILTCLADYHNSVDGGCYPSLGKLAERCCMAESTARSAINGLIEKNLVERVERRDRNGRQRSNQYNLNLNVTDPPADERGDPPQYGPLEPLVSNLKDSDTTYRRDPLEAFMQISPPDGKEFWDEAVGSMMAMGVAEVTSRTFVGKCLKLAANDRSKVLAALTAAVEVGTRDPIPYVSAILGGKKAKNQRAVDDAFAELDRLSAERKAKWKAEYGTEYGILPDTGGGGKTDHGMLQSQPLSKSESVRQNGIGGSVQIQPKRSSEVIRPSVWGSAEDKVSAVHSGVSDGGGEDF